MNFSLMRALDRYFGALIVVALWPFMRLFDSLRRPRTEPEAVRTILVEKFLGIGSIINMLPALDILRRRYPKARIVFVSFREQGPMIANIGAVDECLLVDTSTLPRFTLSLFSALVRLWRLRPDICIDFEFFSRFSMMMSCLSLARVRVGFFSFYNIRSSLLTHPTAFNHYRHISRVFVALVEELAGDFDDRPLSVALPSRTASHGEEVDRLLGERADHPLVVINANASKLCNLRAWPVEYFIALITRIRADYPEFTLVLVGTAAERAVVGEIAAAAGEGQAGRVIDASGRLSFDGLLALVERARLVITNDGGPAHIAAGYRRPSIVFYGPETPVLYAPLNDRATVFYKGAYCSPCLRVMENKSFETCTDRTCLNAISVDEVAAAVREHLSEEPR